MKKLLLFCVFVSSVFVVESGFKPSGAFSRTSGCQNLVNLQGSIHSTPTTPVNNCIQTAPDEDTPTTKELTSLMGNFGVDGQVGLNFDDIPDNNREELSGMGKTLNENAQTKRRVIAQRKSQSFMSEWNANPTVLSLTLPVTLPASSESTPSSTAVIFSPLADATNESSKESKRKAIDALISSVESDLPLTNKKINK